MKSKLKDILNQLNIEDFKNYYLVHNIRDTAKHFNISVDRVAQISKTINFVKTQETINKQIKETKIQRFGSLDNLFTHNNNKRKNTLIEKYGSIEMAEKTKISNTKRTLSKKEGYFLNYINKLSREPNL